MGCLPEEFSASAGASVMDQTGQRSGLTQETQYSTKKWKESGRERGGRGHCEALRGDARG
jgi:hypothetical protein